MKTGSFQLWSEDSVEVKGLSSGWSLYFSDLSAFTPMHDSWFLLLRPIRIHTTPLHAVLVGVERGSFHLVDFRKKIVSTFPHLV